MFLDRMLNNDEKSGNIYVFLLEFGLLVRNVLLVLFG
jgi:hypothetical protein